MMRPSIRRPQPALAGTFEANGIVGSPRLMNAHRGAVWPAAGAARPRRCSLLP